MLLLSLCLFLGVSAAVETSDNSPPTTGEASGSGGNPFLSEIDDEQLWNLLKQASRNGSDSSGNPIYEYDDYPDYVEENEESTSSSSSDTSSATAKNIPEVTPGSLDFISSGDQTPVPAPTPTQNTGFPKKSITDIASTTSNLFDPTTNDIKHEVKAITFAESPVTPTNTLLEDNDLPNASTKFTKSVIENISPTTQSLVSVSITETLTVSPVTLDPTKFISLSDTSKSPDALPGAQTTMISSESSSKMRSLNDLLTTPSTSTKITETTTTKPSITTKSLKSSTTGKLTNTPSTTRKSTTTSTTTESSKTLATISSTTMKSITTSTTMESLKKLPTTLTKIESPKILPTNLANTTNSIKPSTTTESTKILLTSSTTIKSIISSTTMKSPKTSPTTPSTKMEILKTLPTTQSITKNSIKTSTTTESPKTLPTTSSTTIKSITRSTFMELPKTLPTTPLTTMKSPKTLPTTQSIRTTSITTYTTMESPKTLPTIASTTTKSILSSTALESSNTLPTTLLIPTSIKNSTTVESPQALLTSPSHTMISTITSTTIKSPKTLPPTPSMNTITTKGSLKKLPSTRATTTKNIKSLSTMESPKRLLTTPSTTAKSIRASTIMESPKTLPTSSTIKSTKTYTTKKPPTTSPFTPSTTMKSIKTFTTKNVPETLPTTQSTMAKTSTIFTTIGSLKTLPITLPPSRAISRKSTSTISPKGQLSLYSTTQKPDATNSQAISTGNKFDPNKLSFIDESSEEIPEAPHCSGKNCMTGKPKPINVFDTKKLFMIDGITNPTFDLKQTSIFGNVAKKPIEQTESSIITTQKYFIPDDISKKNEPHTPYNSTHSKASQPTRLKPHRKFAIDDGDTQSTPKGDREIFVPKQGTKLRPVINFYTNMKPVAGKHPAGGEPHHYPVPLYHNRSVPELLCFHVQSQERRLRLRCLRIDSNLRGYFQAVPADGSLSSPFVHHDSSVNRNIFLLNSARQTLQQGARVGRVLQIRNPYVGRQGILGHDRVLPMRFRLSLNAPGDGLISVNQGRPMRGEVQSDVTSGRVHRRKRSINNRCNPDNTIYEDEGRTLAIVFDTTGSMQEELEQMREVAKEITTQMYGLKKALISDYVLVSFNDPHVYEPFCTSSYTDFLEKLDEIRVTGGGDCPEMSLTGLERALAVSRPSSFFFVITDASSKDSSMEERIMKLVMKKLPTIFFLLTGTCTEGIQVYTNISTASNRGQIVKNLDKSRVKDIIEVFQENFVRPNLQVLTKISNPVAAPHPYPVPITVDKSVKDMKVTFTGEKPTIDLYSPAGNKTDGERRDFPSLVIINVDKPLPGVWKAVLSSTSGHSISAVGVSDVHFRVGFSVIPTPKISETSHRPLKGGENYALIEVSSPDQIEDIKSIEFISMKGEHIAKIDLKRLPTEETMYAGGPFIPPNEFFNMKLHGIDKNGMPIIRISPSAITPQLPDLPYITMLSRVSSEAGKPLAIRCHVESLVSVNVRLFKKIGTGASQSYSFKQTGDAFLEFKNIALDDQGIYRCWAKNIAGEQFKEIDVLVTAKPPIVAVKEHIYFVPNNPVEIPCFVNSSVEYTVQWKKGEGAHSYTIRNTSRILSFKKGLRFENPIEADEGWYQCNARNPGGVSFGVTYLKLSRRPSIRITSKQNFQYNHSVSITCNASGTPKPEIMWLKNGTSFSPSGNGRITMTKGVIYIFHGLRSDEGTYTCIASNVAGRDSKDTYLVYKEPPKVVLFQRELDIFAGNDILLKCQVTGIPEPQVRWKKDNDWIPESKILPDNTLQIESSSLHHSGTYTCQASNDVGFDEQSISVLIKGVIPEIISPPEDITIEIGHVGRLDCIAFGHPKPRVSWRRFPDKAIRAIQKGSLLEFRNASIFDGGDYFCTAENSLGRKESKARVFISGGVLPVIQKIKDVETTKVLVGDKVELTCTVIGGNPHPEIVWYKDGYQLLGQPVNGIQLENGSYFISAVNPTDTGLFECIAINELGSDTRKIDLKLYEPPKIDVSSRTNIFATVGDSVKLVCNVTGDPTPNVTWRREQHTHHRIMLGMKLESTNDLYFEKVTEDDTGRYVCKAENVAGVARRLFALKVMVPPKIVPWTIENFVEIGNIVTLECRVRATPRPAITWLKDNTTIPRSKYYGQFLRFYASANDSGIYSCTAENKAGKDRVETKLIVLVPPKIEDGPSMIKVVNGQDTSLPCTASGNPQPSIAWQWNGELIKKEFGSDSGALHLINVTETDAGTYICTAQNKAGTYKKKIELIVLTAPKIVPWTVPFKVILNEYFNESCQHSAYPEAKVNWYKNRVAVPPADIGDKNQLQFYVEPHHKGVYTCEAINEAGTDSKDFLLVILDPPSFAQYLPRSVDVLKGENIDVPCVAFGDPKPIISWNKSNTDLSTGRKRIVNSDSGLLTIMNASSEDEGYYNCTAKNKAGEIWQTVEVNVLEIPVAELIILKSLVREGEEVELTCQVSGKPLPKVLWRKDGKILSSDVDNKLRFVAYHKDEGNYTCIAKNSAGEDMSTVMLNVSVLPEIHGPLEERVVVLEGHDVLLNCSSKGIPPPQVFWFFNGTKIGAYGFHTELLNDTTLKLLKVGREREGVYSCEVQNFAGVAKKQISLYVHVPPSIFDHFETEITITEGKDLSIPCNAQGIPEPKISWLKDGYDVPVSGLAVSSLSVHKNILLIYNANNQSAGIYTCKAENENGIALKNYSISIKDIHKPTEPGMEYKEIVESADGVLNCGAKPGSRIIWHKDNKTINKMPLERADDVHFLVGDGGNTLKITEAFAADSGVYSCFAIHPEGNTTKHFVVDVLVPPYFLDLFPETDLTVRENKSLTLECPVLGNPSPIINWRLAESNVPVNQFTVPGVYPSGENGESLHIRSTKPRHAGLYICYGTNKMGKEQRTFSVKVVGPPSRIGPEITQIHIISGMQLELNCSIQGSPTPVLQWSLVQPTGEEAILKYVSQKIQIGYAQLEDEGLYTCSALNPYGNVIKSFNVSVYDVPRIKRDTQNKIILAEGEDLYLKCESENNKLSSVKWFFNGEEVNSSDQMRSNIYSPHNQSEYTYIVLNVTKVKQGSYTCSLSNIAGSDSNNFEVKVVAPPKYSISGLSENLQVNYGEPISLQCPLKSEDELKIVWKKNGNLLPDFENHTLYIPSSEIEDEGFYTCIGSNIAGWLAYKYEVSILAAPEFISSYEDVNTTVLVDGSLVLNCSVFGYPQPDILWTKNLEQINDIILPQILLSENNQVLKIDDIVPSDGGKYSCFASNLAGSSEKHFDVQVVEPPSVSERSETSRSSEKTLTTNLYKRSVLRCPLTGSPEPNITWFKDFDEISNTDRRFRSSFDNKVLIINHAEESTAGIYMCSGKNQIGISNFTFHFHIRIPMQWSQWSKWTECNVTCGGGFQTRQRECLGFNEIFSDYIHMYNDSCSGPPLETQECNQHICPVDGGWGDWSEWGRCSSSCGGGWRRRTRRCNNPPPAHGGSDCPGETYEDEACESIPCPINGNWEEWSDWSECTATCGISIKMRTRRCNNPAPSFGGLPCPGNSRDVTLCRKKNCPEEFGGWSSWSRWSPCSATCGTGRQSRVRTCLLEGEAGKCLGGKRQSRLCKNPNTCTRRRYPRHAELKINGNLNNERIDERITAEIYRDDNETSSIFFSKPISGNETFSYLPFVMSPMSWLTAQENERGQNGFSLTNGTFNENSTYHFQSGDFMEVESNVQNDQSKDTLRLKVKVKGSLPSPPAATIILNPYTEDIIQTGPDKITSTSTVNLEADGQLMPVSVLKNLQFSGRKGFRLSPVESLRSYGSKSHLNKNLNQLEFRANPSVISSRVLRDACPVGFKYNLNTGECTDINECRRRGLNNCQPSQICINTLGSYTCECRQGFRVSFHNLGCKDINECFEGLHQCSHRCINTRGSYQCLCPKRLILAEDMHNCVEESEDYYIDGLEYTDYHGYQLQPNVTHLQETASSRSGRVLDYYEVDQEQGLQNDMFSSHSIQMQDLSCKTGFKPGKDGCEDINECSENENSCTKEQLCMNTPGSFTCIEAPCPENFILSAETRTCLLLCLEEEDQCTDGALLSESLQILSVPVYKGNHTFQPYTNILEMASFDNNDLQINGSIYEIVQNEAGLPVNVRSERSLGILYAVKYFEVTKEERLVLMSSKYDMNGRKLHSTMFVLLIYNIKSVEFIKR